MRPRRATVDVAAILHEAWSRRGLIARMLWPVGAVVGRVGAHRRQQALRRTGVRGPAPVIVVGNLVVGGAGKTPTTLALVDALREHGWQPGIVSRGYGRHGHALVDVATDTPAVMAGDEPLLLRRRADVPVVVAADRVAALQHLLTAHPQTDVVISDDGLQHHQLARDLQIVVFDERGAGNGWCLPAGPLREPMPERPWPNTLAIYNAKRPTTPWPGEMLELHVERAWPLAAWWAGDRGAAVPLSSLGGRRLVAAAGIARPGRFFESLRTRGLEIVPLPLPDHHRFDTLPWPADAEVIVTEKDAVKLAALLGSDAARRVWVAPLDSRLPHDTVRQVLLALNASRKTS